MASERSARVYSIQPMAEVTGIPVYEHNQEVIELMENLSTSVSFRCIIDVHHHFNLTLSVDGVIRMSYVVSTRRAY